MFKLLTVILLWVDLLTIQVHTNFYNYDDNFDVSDNVERAPLDCAFTVLLYHSKYPHRTCLGVIITKWWVLDNCCDFPGYNYEYFKVGWANTKHQKISTYKIEERLCHKDYKTYDFNSSSFDALNLFAAVNALCLHRSRTEIKFIPEIVRAVKLNNKEAMAKRGHALYFHNGTVLKKYVPIVAQTRCNSHFQSYFDKQNIVLLKDDLFCVSPRGISYDDCCSSQALIVSDNILTGVMAWSTGCSKELGIDPWVFTNVGHYISWIAKITDWETFEHK
ncbi:hypothetical protein ILUMI_10354 [Ignelater luminosus]|uniref:Peptidase S1 domain-containing protein n=1 Tax=Ignelater luminosus TaxID=2038154 RepID=A0A8K0D2E9_IGNLU|nr:hypothetical protein ILUMI_10354 [Ignelater luminosus]